VKKILFAVTLLFACCFIYPAAPEPSAIPANNQPAKAAALTDMAPKSVSATAAKTTPTADLPTVSASVPTAQATPRLSAIDIYRQITGNKTERVFPTATPAVTANAIVRSAGIEPASGMTSASWFLISADAALTGWAVFSIIDQNNSVDAYERLKTQLNVPPYANYDFLIREQEKANSKMTVTMIAWSLAGVCLAYTAADLLWLHSAFPAQLRSAYDPATGRETVFVDMRF
jgi:hypothetical protein